MAKHLAARTTPLSSDLADLNWWRALMERVGRQDAQIVVTLFTLGGLSNLQLQWRADLALLASATILTVLKAVAGIKAKLEAPLQWQLFDRAWPAAAAAVLGAVGADSIDWASIDAGRIAQLAGTAALTAIASYFILPPATS